MKKSRFTEHHIIAILKEENRRLKELYAKASLENTILQEAIEGKL